MELNELKNINLQLKVSNAQGSANLALGWADSVISIYGSDNISCPVYNNIDNHLILEIDSDIKNNNDAITPSTEHIQSYIDFLLSLPNNGKLLIVSRCGGKRAVAFAYVYYMLNGESAASALYNALALSDNAGVDIRIVQKAEELLQPDKKYSKFIKVWQTEQERINS